MVPSLAEIDGQLGIYILCVGGLMQPDQLNFMQKVGVVPLIPKGDRRFLGDDVP